MGEWPVELRGVTETVVTTLGPNDLWNVAALGIRISEETNQVRATTWGNTRTRQNFHREGRGYIQFVADPVEFTDAALSIYERDEPLLNVADAWVHVEVEQMTEDPIAETSTGENGDTHREHWKLTPSEFGIECERPFSINRGFGAVVEATVAASRLDVPEYDTETFRERLSYFEDVALKCGGKREREAIKRIREYTDDKS